MGRPETSLRSTCALVGKAEKGLCDSSNLLRLSSVNRERGTRPENIREDFVRAIETLKRTGGAVISFRERTLKSIEDVFTKRFDKVLLKLTKNPFNVFEINSITMRNLLS